MSRTARSTLDDEARSCTRTPSTSTTLTAIDPDGLIDAEVLKECLAKVGEKVDDLIERVEALQASVDALG